MAANSSRISFLSWHDVVHATSRSMEESIMAEENSIFEFEKKEIFEDSIATALVFLVQFLVQELILIFPWIHVEAKDAGRIAGAAWVAIIVVNRWRTRRRHVNGVVQPGSP